MKDKNLENNKKTWDQIADSFNKTRKKPWKEVTDFLEKIPKNCILADIGCGNGRHLLLCSEKCNKILGLDISIKLLKIIKNKINNQNIKNIELINSDVVNLAIKKDSIDFVLYIAALHNIKGRENRIRSLIEIRNILKKEGMALISVWSRWQDKYRTIFFKKRYENKEDFEFGDIHIYWRQHGLNVPRFYHLYSKSEFISDIKESGLKLIKLIETKKHSHKYVDNYFAVVKK